MILIKLRKSIISKFKNTNYIKQTSGDSKVVALETKLSGIKELEIKFREKMKSFMTNHQIIIQKQPAYWIKIMRIIEINERINQMNKASENQQSLQDQIEGNNPEQPIEEDKLNEVTADMYVNIDPEKLETNYEEYSIKQHCLYWIHDSLKTQALDAYQSAFNVDAIIDISERLINSLINVNKSLKQYFPPYYHIATIYYNAYKEVILSKLNPYADNMDKHIEHDKGLLLLLVAFVNSTELVIEKLKIQDESMFELKAKLSKFVPLFLEHIEKLLEDWLIGIRKQFYKQANKILSVRESNIGVNRVSDVSNLWTKMPNDIFKFIQKQFDLIAERLSGSNLFEVLKSTISRFTWIMNNLSEKAEKVSQNIF